MQIGMLWLDDDPKIALQAKIIRAADYYRHKYGQVPNCCHVNPKDLDAEMQIGILTVKVDKSVLPKHLWIGMKETEK